MILSKDEFDRLKPLTRGVLSIPYLTKNTTESGIFIPDDLVANKGVVVHKGTVVKNPAKRVFPMTEFDPEVTYDINVGDTVFFNWNVYQEMKTSKHVQDYENIIKIEETGELYLIISYRQLILAENEERKWGLNGFCGGHYKKKEGLHSKILYLATGTLEEELAKAIRNQGYEELDTSDFNLNEMVVTHAPISYPKYNKADGICETVVNTGDEICFPEGFAMTLNNEALGEPNLIAVNNMQVCAYRSKKTVEAPIQTAM